MDKKTRTVELPERIVQELETLSTLYGEDVPDRAAFILRHWLTERSGMLLTAVSNVQASRGTRRIVTEGG